MPDPDEFEYIREPAWQAGCYLQSGQLEGDCDDASTLAACILSSLGYPAVITAIQRPEDLRVSSEYFSHVYTSSFENGFRIDIDPIVPEYRMPITDVIERMTVRV